MRNQNGFSLLELVTSNAVFAIVVLALASLWVISQDGYSSMDSSNRINDSLHDVRLSLASTNGCSLNLNNMELIAGNPAGSSVPRINAYTHTGVQLRTLIESGVKGDGFVVTDIRLKPIAQLDLSYVNAKLEISYRRNMGFRAETGTREIGLLAQVQNGRVQKCWVRPEQPRISGNQMCQAMTGGALNEWDPVTKSCKLTNGVWFTGATPYSAECPEGTALPRFANDDYNCLAEEPSGFADPRSDDNVDYLDANNLSSEVGPPYFAELDHKKRTCTCAYDTALPVETIKGFKCKILCVVL